MKYALSILLGVTFFINIVFPNAFQIFSVGLLILCNLFIAFSKHGFGSVNLKLRLIWFILSILFSAYILVSDITGNDKLELFIRYIISPYLWINICNYTFKNYNSKKLLHSIFNLFIISSASVIILYVLTSMGYENITSLFISTVNINQSSGLGFTLHVYGSMIFFSTAMFPILIISKKSVILKMILFFLLVISIILSGRTALYLSLFMSCMTFIVKYRKNYTINSKNIFFIICSLFIIYLLFVNFYQRFFDVNLFTYFEETHLAKIEEGGGSERSQQWAEITQAFYNNPIGNGFISLNIIRDIERPYNFEMLIVITLMRFGIFVSLLILFSLKDILKYGRKFLGSKNYFADIMFLGFFGIIIASFTNPYLESLSFQWMFFGPLIYFFNYHESNISK